jgi:transcriptional regulator with XRE-family HTH domain
VTILTGPIIRTIRQNRGLSLSDLCERTDYSKAYLSWLERGVTPMTEEARRRIQRAFKELGVTEAEIDAAVTLLEVTRRGY